MINSNLLITLVCVPLLFTVVWTLLRYGNYRRMSWPARFFCLVWIGYLASRGYGSYLRATNDRGQPWDMVTASLITISAVIAATLAESTATAIKRLLDSQVREKLLSSIFAGLPSSTILVLGEGSNLLYQEFSNTFGNLYGLSPKLGDSHYDLFPGLKEAVPQWADQIESVIWDGQSIAESEPVSYPRPNGGEGFATYSLNPIRHQKDSTSDAPYLALLIWRDVTTIHQLRQEVERLVYRDDLTGLFNRRFFDERLNQMLLEQKRGGGPVSIILIDIDHFGEINSKYGHPGGNAVLVEVGERLSLSVRGGDTAVRWGGDELVVLCENTGVIAALKAAKRLHHALTAQPMFYQGAKVDIRASIGAATQLHYESNGAESLLEQADSALYRAKDLGRNRIAGSPEAEAHLDLENRIAAAVAAGEIHPWYQPIFCLKSGDLVGAEALARWEHDGKIDYPGVFLPVIESSEPLTFAFCESQLIQCCHHVKSWQSTGIWTSFNISQRSLERSDLVQWLRSCFERTGVSPDAIAIETTERLQSPDPSVLETLLNVSFDDLLSSGMRLLLDDFGGAGGGTGIQLSWMVRALSPAATVLGTKVKVLVKLDRRLVEGIHINEPQRRLTEGVINTIKGVGLTVIAEGVETQAEADCLNRLGCDYVQGWLYDRAMPADEFRKKYLSNH